MNTETLNQTGIEADFVRYMCDHLVVLGGSYISLDAQGLDAGKEMFFYCPGFILSVRGVWCFVTSSHAIQELEDNLRTKRIQLVNCSLVDYLDSKPRVEEPMPFDYVDCDKIYIDDEKEGLDFALLTIRESYQQRLQANGIRSISEINWVAHDVSGFEIFCLLGTANCLVDHPFELRPYGDRMAGIINPVLVNVQHIKLAPEKMPISRYPWFVGRVGADNALPDITGMSGGPIFGFAKRPDGMWEYWIVAVQSRWHPPASHGTLEGSDIGLSRVIYGCPVRIFADLVEQELQRLEATPPRQGLEPVKTCALMPNVVNTKPGTAANNGVSPGSRTHNTKPPLETPVEPWKHLVARKHPWREQLFIKGRNMTVRQLVGTVKANQFSEEQAAKDLGLPSEAIREAFAYFEANPEVIEQDAAYERYLRKIQGVGLGPESVPG